MSGKTQDPSSGGDLSYLLEVATNLVDAIRELHGLALGFVDDKGQIIGCHDQMPPNCFRYVNKIGIFLGEGQPILDDLNAQLSSANTGPVQFMGFSKPNAHKVLFELARKLWGAGSLEQFRLIVRLLVDKPGDELDRLLAHIQWEHEKARAQLKDGGSLKKVKWTAARVARFIGISSRTARNWIADHRFAHAESISPRLYEFDQEELDKLRDSQLAKKRK